LYDNLVESLERYKGSSGFGCILAHSMGLGKTLQVISFIDILLRHTGAHTVLAIVPVSILLPLMISMLLFCTHLSAGLQVFPPHVPGEYTSQLANRVQPLASTPRSPVTRHRPRIRHGPHIQSSHSQR